jgi:hypothetical protein
MRLFPFLAYAAVIPVAFAFSQLPRSGVTVQPPDKTDAKASENGFYCDRSALTPGQLKRKVELGHSLRSSIRHTRELPDGFEFELNSGASVQDAAEWAGMERLCCPFFDIGLQLTRDKGPTLLRLTGRAGVKQFIHAEFGPEWFENPGETNSREEEQ